MSIFNEAGRQVGHVFLDAVVAQDPDADHDRNIDAVNLVWQRIAEIDDAYSLTRDQEGQATLDLSNVLGGAWITIDALVRLLAKTNGIEPEQVVAEIRKYLDA